MEDGFQNDASWECCQLELRFKQTNTLMEQLESTRAERDVLMFEKETSHQTSTEEKEELQRRLTCLNGEKKELQDTLEVLRQERQQLRAELEDRMEMVKT